MSLRAKLLLMFAALSVAPLLLVGAIDYLNSVRAVEAHLAAQVGQIAGRAARELENRYAVHRSDLLLLAENAETQRLYRSGRADPEARASAGEYFDHLWAQYSAWYEAIELRDLQGTTLYRLGDPTEPSDLPARAPSPIVSIEPVRDPASGARLGQVVAFPRLAVMLPLEALQVQFGESGESAVFDRRTGQILYHPQASLAGHPIQAAGSEFASAARAAPATAKYGSGDSLRIAAFAGVPNAPWMVASSSAVAEFAAPFARARFLNLLLTGLVAAAVSLASVLLVRRETRSLAALTAAADRIGQGDFTPALPPSGTNEVGRLSAAFAVMAGRIREMMGQIEASRQMAAIGEFTAELAHEIRNPLTSVKLNLQRIERAVEERELPPETVRPLAISLREIRRLERVVRGVLHLGRPRSLVRRPCSIHGVIHDTLELARAQTDRQGIAIEADLDAVSDRVSGDAGELRGALLNLLLNSAEAMPGGGSLRISTDVATDDGGGAESIRIRIVDTGAGIPPEVRQRLFRPFATTKPEGTGLGLAIALRTVEEHGGRLELQDTGSSGTTFVVELPLAAAGAAV